MLNAKIDYDGGNYKGSGLANYVVDKSGDTMTGNLTIDRETTNAAITLNSDMVALGGSPTGGKNTASIYFDQKSVITGIIQNVAREDGGNGLQLALRDPSNTAWHSLHFMVNKDNIASFDFPKCTTKATTTSTASAGKVAVVIQNYVNGASWYRVWSDGWIEQGGVSTLSDNWTITFLKPFSNSNYVLISEGLGQDSTGNLGVTSKTAKSASGNHSWNANHQYDWYACGY